MDSATADDPISNTGIQLNFAILKGETYTIQATNADCTAEGWLLVQLYLEESQLSLPLG